MSGLAFLDTLPAGVVIATPSNAATTCTGGTLSAPAGTSVIIYTGGTLAARTSCTLSVDVTSSTTGAHLNTTGNLISFLGNSGTASDTLTVNLNPAADLAVTKTDGVTTATPGQSLTYTIVASNAGPSDDPSVALTDTFPSPPLTCTFTSVAAGGATGNTAAGSGDLAETLSMPAGSSVTYTVTCTLDAAATGTLSNTATVTSSVIDPTPGNNSATDNDTLLAPPPVPGTTTTVANTTTTFSNAAQDVALDAMVDGSVVNEGTVTFQVKDGTLNIGTAVTSATVSNSMASVTYSLPGGTVPKAYTIQASYSGGPNFGASTGTGTLTITPVVQGIPTLPQWGMILLTLSLLTMATWQLAGRPVLVRVGSSSTVALLPSRRQWLTSLLLGQGIATLGLGLYALLLGPLVPHDGGGAFLSGLLIGVMVECYRRSWSR